MARRSLVKSAGFVEKEERTKSKNLSSLKLLFDFALPYWVIMLGAFIALVAAALGTLSIGRVIQLFIDRGFSSNSDGMTQVFLLSYLVVAVIAGATFARYYLVMWLGERVIADLRNAIYKRIITLSPAYFEVNKTGEILSRLTVDTTLIQGLVGAGASVALRNILLLIGGLCMLIFTSLKLSALIILTIPLIVLPLIIFGRRVKELSRKTQAALADVTSGANESLNEIRTVQAYSQEENETTRFKEKINHSLTSAISQIKARGWLTFAIIGAVLGSIVSVLWIGAIDVRSGSMSGGDLAAFVVYSLMTAGALASLSEVYGDLQRAAGAAERIQDLLFAKSDIDIPKEPVIISSPKGAMELNSISFNYPTRPELRVLNNFSIKISPGEMIAIVGPSGAGKTTIFQLLMRYYDPQEGYISFDDTDIIRFEPKSYRSNVGFVSQDSVIFDLNAWDNIGYGNPGANKNDIRRAAEQAEASEFLDRLPDGFNTMLGERGVTLSGGQKQRISIARAILKNPSVLLLDEATSSLDAENEQLIQQTLEKLMRGRTTLVIAHRLSTVQKADRIIVIDNGKIVEEGTHDQLVVNSGLYSRIARLQFKPSNIREIIN